jgi:signal transduction histidine kinase
MRSTMGREDADLLSIAGGEREIVVRILNAGVIPPELLPTIFEPFHGSQTKSSSRFGGLGLGLFISKEIAMAHDGDIAVDSSSPSATVFTVRLPRRREPDPSPETGAKDLLKDGMLLGEVDET